MFNSPCKAGGGEYEYADDTEEAGPAYFGFVRDDRGINISGAKAILTSKSGIKIETKTNVLGVYRTHISKLVKPEDVTLSCQKEGYSQIRLINRPNTTKRYVETDCILKKTN
jgi:hypothetical protein